ncbi:hypothetical protein CF165_39310 [Amycolatopsis vastitatis]|uniref:Uncharacterized protein n=1 Tax=Amycolatopsis vastitatis TaxID=1905142 RepID=A0A229SQZ5_9PSEU|nr:hypothetical protein CF165_39310 [Amycolatopsis vastitatis]
MRTGKLRSTTQRAVAAHIASELPTHLTLGVDSVWAEAVPVAPRRTPVVNTKAPIVAVMRRMAILLS